MRSAPGAPARALGGAILLHGEFDQPISSVETEFPRFHIFDSMLIDVKPGKSRSFRSMQSLPVARSINNATYPSQPARKHSIARRCISAVCAAASLAGSSMRAASSRYLSSRIRRTRATQDLARRGGDGVEVAQDGALNVLALHAASITILSSYFAASAIERFQGSRHPRPSTSTISQRSAGSNMETQAAIELFGRDLKWFAHGDPLDDRESCSHITRSRPPRPWRRGCAPGHVGRLAELPENSGIAPLLCCKCWQHLEHTTR